MKLLWLLPIGFLLASCNTSIGIYRDGKAAFDWTRDKFQGGGGQYEEQYGAPIY